jgi:gliding motility-associated-like protein
VKKLILTYLFSFTVYCIAFAQETMYVPVNSTIHFGNTNAAGVFGYLRNNGNMSMAEGAQLFFLGKIWMNESEGIITDGSAKNNSDKGGTVTFTQPNPVYGNQGQQIFHPGYNTTNQSNLFSNIVVNNNSGVILTEKINILNSLQFRRGHLYLNGFNTEMGDSVNNGKISGYDQSRYVVTGQGAYAGFLTYKSVLESQSVVFPIGPRVNNYTPLQVLNKGPKDEFYARAYDTAFAFAVTGPVEADSTLQLTWELGKKGSINSDAVVTLQNDIAIEDPVFRNNRQKSYVSLYGRLGWDKPSFLANGITRGNLTTSFPITTGLMNSRTLNLTNKPLYLTKKVTKGTQSIVIPNVFSPNGDNINDVWNIRALKDYTNCTVEIYNRWGQLVFRSMGYQQPWDGTYNGKPLPVATYYYLIDLRNGEKPLAGSVTLLR